MTRLSVSMRAGVVLCVANAALGQAVRISHVVGHSVSNGSGSLIAHDDGASYFLTCAHVFDDGPGRVSVLFPGSGRIAAAIVDRDRPHDLALLVTARVEGTPVRFDPDAPVEGVLRACGYGPAGVFRAVRGLVTGYATPTGARHPSLRMRGAVRPGDSGGPVVDASNRLVGVVWGQRDGETYATFGEPLRRMMARLTQCRQGMCVRPPRYSPSVGRLVPVERSPRSAGVAPAIDARLSAIDERLSDLGSRFEEHLEQCENATAGDVRLAAKINAIAVRLDEFDGSELSERVSAVERRLADLGRHPGTRRHYTLVADQRAENWPRLADEYQRARQNYQGVRLAAPPRGRTGPLPALVEWEDKTPVGNVGGYRAVSEALRSLSEGRGPQLNQE